jgi:hypothetical protein
MNMLGLIMAFAGLFVVIVAVYSQLPEYRGIPKPVFWDVRKSVIIAGAGIIIFLLGILIERAGI